MHVLLIALSSGGDGGSCGRAHVPRARHTRAHSGAGTSFWGTHAHTRTHLHVAWRRSNLSCVHAQHHLISSLVMHIA